MAASHDELNEKFKAHKAQFEICKEHAYEHPEYQKYFQLNEELVDYIIEEHSQGRLDGKDLYDSKIELPRLFGMVHDPDKRNKAEEKLELIEADIETYLNSDS